MLEDFGIRNQEDLQKFIPAAVIEPYDMAIRGVGRNFRSLGGDRLDAATRRQIVMRAEGNPLYLEALTVSALAGGDLPGRLVEALLAPVRALSQPARDLVNAAAVWGSPARPDELAELAGLLDAREVRDARQVGADGEDERLAGHRDRDDLARGGRGLDLVHGSGERREAAEPEGARARVVPAVVERDESGLPGRAGQVDDAYVGVRDDLVGRARGGGGLGHRRHSPLPS